MSEVEFLEHAGLRLWEIQRRQATGLCVGLDPHYDPETELNEGMYSEFASDEARTLIGLPSRDRTSTFISGVTGYYLRVIRSAWSCGIRVFKPQAAFYERFTPYGMTILQALCRVVRDAAGKSGEDAFLILDAKRGDIDSTQAPYYWAYLAGPTTEVFPGASGVFGFDATTVTTWMGSDVLVPGLPFFRQGKAAIVVTRSSNPSGATLQDQELGSSSPNLPAVDALTALLGRRPLAHELMLYDTEEFSERHGLNVGGVSPLFSVMGSTVRMSDSFRKIRPNGIALVPGFGAQGGRFENVMPLLVNEGPLKGHIGILSSSRDHNFPWMKRAGGSGDPSQLEPEMQRAIDGFRVAEKRAYEGAGAEYPF
jgi:orotidine 5'-phosphate decarboxylase subfamily 2